MSDFAVAGIDHALVGVRDLEAAKDAWRKLGFLVTPRGRHVGWGTANYCMMFDQGYVELLGIVDPSRFTNNLDRFLAMREGLLGLAFASHDAERTHDRLTERGLRPDRPKELKRLLEMPGGDVELAFRLVMLPAAATPGIGAFCCQHLSQDLIRRPGWGTHPNGARLMKGVTVIADAPDTLAPAYRRLFGERAVRAFDGGIRVDAGQRTFLRFLTAEAARAALLDVTIGDFPRPWMLGMTIGVVDAVDSADFFDAAGIPIVPTPDGIAVPPSHGNGALVEFVARDLD